MFEREWTYPETKEIMTSILSVSTAVPVHSHCSKKRWRTSAATSTRTRFSPSHRFQGLIDSLRYRPYLRRVEDRAQTVRSTSCLNRDYLKVTAGFPGLEGKPRLRFLWAEATLRAGASSDDILRGGSIVAEGFDKLLRRSKMITVSVPDRAHLFTRATQGVRRHLAEDEPCSAKEPLVNLRSMPLRRRYYKGLAMTWSPIVAYPGGVKNWFYTARSRGVGTPNCTVCSTNWRHHRRLAISASARRHRF